MTKARLRPTDLRVCGYRPTPVSWPDDEPGDDFAEEASTLLIDDSIAAEVCAEYVRSRSSALTELRKPNQALHDSARMRAAEWLLLERPQRFAEVAGIEDANVRKHVEHRAKECADARFHDRQRMIRHEIESYVAHVVGKGFDRWIAEAAMTGRHPDVVRKLLRLSASPVLDQVLEIAAELERGEAVA